MLLVAGRQASFFIVLFFISQLFRDNVSQQCGSGGDLYSIYQMMLKGHTYKSLKTAPGTLECREACLADVKCQSYNVVMFIAICELNNRSKEARPEDFVKNKDRYYMAKGPKRVPLGSIRELPAESCKEIKTSEGGKAVSGNNYWMDSTRSGNSILADCDMKTEVADYCVKHQCQNDAKCVNGETNYACDCNSGWTGNYCEKAEHCDNYKNLSDANRKSSYVTSHSTEFCDRELLVGWYRFVGAAGTKMPTTRVPTFRCGTYLSGWLDGAHPTVEDGEVSRTICFSDSVYDCRYRNHISVKNCGSYFIYKLLPPPRCNSRYCGTD